MRKHSSLPFSLEVLIHSSWDKLFLFHLSPEQREELLASLVLMKEKCVFPAGKKFGRKFQEKPEMALVVEGAIRYEIDEQSHQQFSLLIPKKYILRTRTYLQRKDDVLVLPQGTVHVPIIEFDKPCVAYAMYKK